MLIDRFLEDAFEADVDAISDGTARRDRRHHAAHRGRRHSLRRLGVRAAAVSASASATWQTMREQTIALAKALGVVGLINVQYAIKDGVVYVLEVNPRASRTIPFVSKAIGVPLASLAARVMMGETLERDRLHRGDRAAVRLGEGGGVPVQQVPRASIRCSGPEMRSTGEVHGHLGFVRQRVREGAARGVERAAARGRGPHHGERFRQADGDADRASLPRDGVRDLRHARARRGYLRARGIPASRVFKVHEGRPNCLDMIVNGDVQLLINTPLGKHAQRDDYTLRQAAIRAARRVHDDAVGGERRVATRSSSLRSRARAAVRSLQEWQQRASRDARGSASGVVSDRSRTRSCTSRPTSMTGATIGDGHEDLAFLPRHAAAR